MADKVLLPIDYTSKDYEAFRNDMINIIPRKLPNWTDFSSSDAGITLIELFSYMGDILSYYQDRIANEVYLPTATQRKSIIDITKLIDYQMKPDIPSKSKVVFSIVPQTFNFVIPRGFRISTEQTQYEDAIMFETDSDLTIPAGATGLEMSGGEYLYAVNVTQGITIRDEIIGSSTGTANQAFPLKYPQVINAPSLGFATIQVSVNEGAGFELWSDGTQSTEDTPESGKYYTTEVDENNVTTIVFGDGISGKIPTVGVDNLKATYRVGGGFHTNVGAGTIKVLQSSLIGVKTVTNIIAATGGVDRESIEETRSLAPKSHRSSSRAVTKADYETLSKTIPGVAKASADVDPVVATKVNVTIAPVGGGVPTEDLRQSVFSLLDDLKIIMTQVDIKDPLYLTANLELKVNVQDGFTQAEVKTYVDEAVTNLFAFSNRDFGQGEFISRLYQVLNPLLGVRFIEITRLSIEPRVDWITVTGNPTWSRVNVLPANSLENKWRVKMTSATAFQVDYDTAGDGTFSTSKGTGTFGTEFTSSGGELKFTITAGTIPCVANDYWTFRASKYLTNIQPDSNEILLLNVPGYIVTMEGGFVG
jgi:hypothetical protein